MLSVEKLTELANRRTALMRVISRRSSRIDLLEKRIPDYPPQARRLSENVLALEESTLKIEENELRILHWHIDELLDRHAKEYVAC